MKPRSINGVRRLSTFELLPLESRTLLSAAGICGDVLGFFNPHLMALAPANRPVAHAHHKGASMTVVGATAPAAPSELSASVLSATSIQLTWTNTDPSASGYYVLRSTDGIKFSQVAKLSSATASSYLDKSVKSGHAYYYEVKSFSGTVSSAASNVAAATTPLAAVSSLLATLQSSTSAKLSWKNNDGSATGYLVLRSVDGAAFAQLVKLTSGGANTYTDNSISAGHSYAYAVQAYDAVTAAAFSNVATVGGTPAPALPPSGLTATTAAAGTSVGLSWTDNDASASGYLVLRSADGGATYSQIAQLTSASANTYTDATVSAGQAYCYEVQATYAGGSASAPSNVASVTVPTAASGGGGGGGSSVAGSVAITTRFDGELVITASGGYDAITLSQAGSLLTILADGQTYTESLPADGLFVYTRGGNDVISVDGSVAVHTTVETIDGSFTTINSAAGANVSVWMDSTDSFSGSGTVHRVSAFAGNVSKAAGASLANPTDAGATTAVNLSLWGAGPVAGDANQGELGDCYFIASVAAFAGVKPSVLTQSAVDMGDGTYTVQFYSSGKPVYVRVSNQLSTGPFSGYMYAYHGANNTMWVSVLEKAFAYFRTGANTYRSLSSGAMNEVYTDLGVSSSTFYPNSYTESAFYSMVSKDLNGGEAVTFATTTSPPNLVSNHAYTLVGVSVDANGVTNYTVRNPWGFSGDGAEDGAGYATLTFAQLKANFGWGCQAYG